MPNVTVPAAASGLPKFNRRAALALLSVAVATPVAAADADRDAAVLEATAHLAAAVAAVAAAMAAKTSALEAFERAKPTLPRRLLAARQDLHLSVADELLDGEGKRLVMPDHGSVRIPRRVIHSRLLQTAIDEAGADTVEGRHAAKLLPVALRYERGVAEAREASRLDTALDAECNARRDLAKLALSIAEMPIRTLGGLRIKAEAFDAYSSLGIAEADHAAGLMAPAIVRDLMTIIPSSGSLGTGGPAHV